jgi:hypothetical protein
MHLGRLRAARALGVGRRRGRSAVHGPGRRGSRTPALSGRVAGARRDLWGRGRRAPGRRTNRGQSLWAPGFARCGRFCARRWRQSDAGLLGVAMRYSAAPRGARRYVLGRSDRECCAMRNDPRSDPPPGHRSDPSPATPRTRRPATRHSHASLSAKFEVRSSNPRRRWSRGEGRRADLSPPRAAPAAFACRRTRRSRDRRGGRPV